MKSILKKIVVNILTWEARLVLTKYKPKIIAITGSVGKTSTKDAIFAVLTNSFSVRKSDKSFNGEIGIPLTILGLPNGWNNPFMWLSNVFRGLVLCIPIPHTIDTRPFPSWLVLEVGADHPGDIEKLKKWLHPDVVVITRLSETPVHVEFFKSPKDVIREKGFLVQSLKDNGLLILNSDDLNVMSMKDLKRDAQLLIYGMEEPSDFQASNLEITYEENKNSIAPSGITFKINYSGNSIPVALKGRFGRQHVYPALVALAVGNHLGLNVIKMSEYIKNYTTSPGRMKILAGIKNTTIIDDTYNSSPVAVSEALRTLGEIHNTKGRKIAILGDMLELGKYSIKAHEKAGKEASETASILVTIGIKARDIAMGALDNGMDEKNIYQFDKSLEAGKFIEEMIEDGDVILIKGSQGVRMEKIVEEIMAEPERKEELLVRQELEWQNR